MARLADLGELIQSKPSQLRDDGPWKWDEPGAPPPDQIPPVEPDGPPPPEGGPFNPNVYNGQRVCLPNSGVIFLVMKGVMRWIPEPETYLNLFGDRWSRYTVNQGKLRYGTQLLPGTVLLKAPDAPEIYLFDLGKRRHITSPAVMDRYQFPYDNVRHVPSRVLSQLAEGEPIVEDWH